MNGVWELVKSVPCEHIADFYRHKWKGHKCLAWSLLIRGYSQWASGLIEYGHNNLYGTRG